MKQTLNRNREIIYKKSVIMPLFLTRCILEYTVEYN
jgi:hypothetical protein